MVTRTLNASIVTSHNHLHSFISSPPPRLSSPHSPPLHPLPPVGARKLLRQIHRFSLQLCSLFAGRYTVAIYMTMGLGSLMVSLKSKIRGLKMKKPYDKIEKSDSMRVEIRSRKAKKLIEETLKIADSPRSKTYAL
ncbi:hypothetical protein OIU77_001595 [Salix suchowensis]|uniref:Transmembrane protein n=1 Tax=Salix suchowensis TaxID=1278906 RepID=A0ABQ9B396_9ROSI|nr:hypothetical protein OIU77_001595 [Salix suchowensis]